MLSSDDDDAHTFLLKEEEKKHNVGIQFQVSVEPAMVLGREGERTATARRRRSRILQKEGERGNLETFFQS